MIEKKKILLVSNGFYPEISPRSFRATELAKEFFRQGHDVTVITKFREYDYREFLKEFPVTFKMWRKPKMRELQEFRNKFFKTLARKAARILSVLFEYPGIEEMFIIKRMLRGEKDYDLLISFAVPYPVHWGTGLSRTLKHRIAEKWVADCGDPYMGDVLDSIRKPFYFGYLEKMFCERADYISIPVESAKPGYYPDFHNKIITIPQGFNFEIEALTTNTNINKVISFAYAGGFLKGIRDPEVLFNELKKIDLPYRFYIFTNQTDLIARYQQQFGDKLIISEYINRNDLMKKLSGMDFLINFDNNTTLNVPSKLIDYSITGRPVLNIDSTFAFKDIFDFLNGDFRNKMKLPEPQKYHIRNVAGQFLNLI